MRHQRIITFIASLLCVLTVMSGNTVGTITLSNNGNDITAEALIDLDNSIVTVGNGQNACIPHYTQGIITIPGSVIVSGTSCRVAVGQLAFRLCNQLTEIVIGEGVREIGDFAFVGCSSLQKVTLPRTMERIGGGAFVNLPALKEVKCDAITAPFLLYNDVFAYEGTAEATSRLADQRTLYVPRNSTSSYRQSKYDKVMSWTDAFGRISEATAPTQVLEISSFSELETLRSNVNSGYNNYGDYTIRLTTDLVFEGTDYDSWKSWVPIGTADHPFMGVFDGGGHIIKNMKNFGSNTTNTGLFGYTETASIGNLILQNISMQGTSAVGVVAGTAINTLIHDVLILDAKSTSGTVYYCAQATDGNAGGIVGYAKNTNIDNCYFYGKVSGTTAVGGIVGDCSEIVSISDCASAYSIEGSGSIGGIVGIADKGTTVQRCYSRSTLTGNASNKGGIVGCYTIAGEGLNSIVSCCWFDENSTTPVANSSVTEGFEQSGNQRFSTIAAMENNNMHSRLGDKQWYYFHDDMNDCPIPASLAEAYQQWSGIKNSDGYIFLDNGSTYTIVGYEGNATDITLPTVFKEKPVTAVAARVFEGCGVTNVTIPNTITTIGAKAFANCEELTTLSIGSGVSSAYDGWLDGCLELTDISVDAGNTAYTIDNGILYNMDKTMLIRCSSNLTGTLTVPSTVTAIKQGAFANCDNLKIIDLRQTTEYWDFQRTLPTNPFYEASKYTLFIMNNNTGGGLIEEHEPNVIYNDYGELRCRRLLLTDRLGFQSPVTFTADSVGYDRDFSPNIVKVQDDEDSDPYFMYQPKAYTFCLPFKPSIPTDKGAKLYVFEGISTEDGVTTVNFHEANHENVLQYQSLHKNYPYYLVADSKVTFDMGTSFANTIEKEETGTGLKIDNYSFVGTTVEIPNSELYDAQQPKYILQSDGNWHKVPQGQEKAYVGAFRAYFKGPQNAETKMLTTNFDEEDNELGVTIVRTTDANGTQHYYDLSGRRLSEKPHNGIYIYNNHVYQAK